MQGWLKESLKLLLCLAICQLAGLVGGLFTSRTVADWYPTLVKSSLNPPGWVFAPVWISLFLLMGLALYLVWRSERSPHRLMAAVWFFAQLSFNIMWSGAFFGLKSPRLGLEVILILWGLILITMLKFYKISVAAAWLMLPYLLWVSFAVYLNWEIFRLNPLN